MEVKEKSKKREIIKTVAIVFLAVLLLLTFFSNTIMNRSLPEVATQAISSGTINAKIRGSGTVAANETYEVILNQTREVREVCVGVGDMVSQGDLLFVLGDMESQELTTAQDNLDSLNMQYEERLLTLSKTYATEDRAVEVLREQLKKAQEQRDANKVTAEEISAAKSALAAAEADLNQLALTISELEAIQGDNTAYSEAQAAVTKWTTAMETAQQQIDSCREQLSELNSGSSGSNYDILDAKAALESAELTLQSDWNAYESYFAALLKEATGASSLPSVKKEDIVTYQGQINTYLTRQALLPKQSAGTETEVQPQDTTEYQHPDYNTYKMIYAELLEDQKAVDSAKQTYDRLVREQNLASGDLAAKRSELQAQLNQASSDYNAAGRQLQQAQYALQQAEGQMSALKEQIKAYESAQRQRTADVKTQTEAVSELEKKKGLYDAALEEISSTESSIEDALTGKNIDHQLNDLSLEALRKQIEKAQAQVDKYTADSVDTQVTANVSGRITAINVSAGKETTVGTAMAVIDVVDRGYVIKIPVTNEQSRQVKVGDTANVTNYYWGNDVEATLESIVSDPSNPGQGKLLVFRVTGEIDAGTNITLSIGQRSANYDAIVPKSALREDTNGYFVLVITVKSSPLSNRYVATRVDVQVLAEDDTSAAVSGVSSGDFVITTSSKPVEAGAQVRMVENS